MSEGSRFTLRRLTNGPNSTPGELLDADGAKLCATLERAWLNNKRAESRIPPGTYSLKLKKFGDSRFDRHYRQLFGDFHAGMILVDGVPDRSQILIHMANWAAQLEGCIAAGAQTIAHGQADFQIPPGESRDGYLIAYPRLLAAVREGNAKLTVTDPVPNGAALIA